jgi:hypothetical protein
MLVSFLLIFGFGTEVFAQDKPKENDIDFGLDFRPIDVNILPGYFGKIENVPLELRQVISHPDDTWIYGSKRTLITIPENSIGDMGRAGALSVTLSGELKLYRLRLRSGPNYYLLFSGRSYPEGTDAVREVNQFGTSGRGNGTSLVYYKMRVRPVLNPGWTHEADFRVYNGWMAVGGYSINRYKLAIETGYDRWNAYSPLERKEISRNRLAKIYGGFGWRDITGEMGDVSAFLLIGKTKTTFELADIAKGMHLTYGDNYYVSAVVSTHFF